MFAKIVGAFMLVGGVILAFKSIGAVVGGILGFLGMVLMVGVIGIALYLGWRLINSDSTVARVIGAFVLVGGILGALPAAFAVVAGTLGAVFLVGKLVLIALLIYFGWRWLQAGDFTAPRRGGFRRREW